MAAPKGNDNPPPQGMWLAENLTPPGTHAGDVNVGDVDGNPTRRGWYVVCVLGGRVGKNRKVCSVW